MQNLSKREWGPNLTLKNANDICIGWLIRARQKNVVNQKNPQLYYSYIMSDSPDLMHLNSISSIFKYSQKDSPYIDKCRNQILKLLSVAIKAHFFLFNNNLVEHEPYFIALPNLADPSSIIFSLVYKIANENKSIVVSEVELEKMFEENKILFKFPVVIQENSFNWFNFKIWHRYKEESIELGKYISSIKSSFDKTNNANNNKDSAMSDKVENPHIAKKEKELAMTAKTRDELMHYGAPLDVSLELKDLMKPTGILWHPNIKTWYLPKGFDLQSVTDYLSYLKKYNTKVIVNKKT